MSVRPETSADSREGVRYINPITRFLSDNTGGASPEILDAVVAANSGLEYAYGDDRWSRRLDQVFGEFFGAAVRVFPVATGTAANALCARHGHAPLWSDLYPRGSARGAR